MAYKVWELDEAKLTLNDLNGKKFLTVAQKKLQSFLKKEVAGMNKKYKNDGDEEYFASDRYFEDGYEASHPSEY